MKKNSFVGQHSKNSVLKTVKTKMAAYFGPDVPWLDNNYSEEIPRAPPSSAPQSLYSNITTLSRTRSMAKKGAQIHQSHLPYPLLAYYSQNGAQLAKNFNWRPLTVQRATAKSRTVMVRLISMAMTGYYRTLMRPRAHRPLSMMKYDPIGTLASQHSLLVLYLGILLNQTTSVQF